VDHSQTTSQSRFSDVDYTQEEEVLIQEVGDNEDK
jgi:hypothetical protein